LHTSRHTSKNSSFSTQDEHLMLLGLEALTDAPNLRYATRSMYVDPYFKPIHICSTVISLVAVIAWLLIVSETWVRDAAHAYAVRLLAACEQKSPAAPKRRSKKVDSSEKEPPEKV